ncbi:MAG: hypothetical protein HYZ22_00810, partial [Chloroflexi bacterium]|nr:hypothetical protein [Chloroflexota bacterium]
MDMENSNPTLRTKTWFQVHMQKIGALSFWILLIVVYQWYAKSNGLSSLEVAQKMLDFL